MFKTHYGDAVSNQVVGVGFFSGSVPLPVSRAWEIFGEGNGCRNETEMRQRISKYRRAPIGPAEDPEIGCIMLRDVVFARPRDALPAPVDWPKNVVQGKSYDLAEPGGSVIEQMLETLLARHGGENRVDNGLLLRSDVHTLFDKGYLSVHPDRRSLMVSPRLRSDFGNGEEFYAREASGAAIVMPQRRADRPAREFLEWHADTVFKVS